MPGWGGRWETAEKQVKWLHTSATVHSPLMFSLCFRQLWWSFQWFCNRVLGTDLSHSAGSISSAHKYIHISLILKHKRAKSPLNKRITHHNPPPTPIHPPTHFHTSISEVYTLYSSPLLYSSCLHHGPPPPVADQDFLMEVIFQLPSATVNVLLLCD